MYLLNYYLKNKLLKSYYIKEDEFYKIISHFKYYDANIIEENNLIIIKEDDWNRIEIYSYERN